MPDDHDLARRLQRLEADVTVNPPQGDRTSTNTFDVADWHVRSVMLDRIARLTMELQRRGDAAVDVLDALEMRLLLNDYTASTTHLRAVTRIANQSIATASRNLKGVRTTLERELRRAEEDGRSSADS